MADAPTLFDAGMGWLVLDCEHIGTAADTLRGAVPTVCSLLDVPPAPAMGGRRWERCDRHHRRAALALDRSAGARDKGAP